MRKRKPSTAKVTSLLDELAQKQETQDQLSKRVNALIQNNPDLQKINVLLAQVGEEINSLREEIKTAVLQHGQTIKGERLQAVWCNGRTSWNTKALDGYAAAHPEILTLKSEGEPTVQFRKV